MAVLEANLDGSGYCRGEESYVERVRGGLCVYTR